MKRLSKNRVLSLFLALVMLFSALPFNTVGANASTSIGDINPNYGSVIGNTAQFNIEDSINFLIHNDPENFDYDTESGDWANDEYWIWYYAEEEKIDFPENLELVITNYFWDSETTALWYKVEAAPGQTLPEKLKQYPWVYQNFTENYEDPELLECYHDLLNISSNGKNYVFDEDGNQVSSIVFTNYKSKKIHAESTLQGSVKYQWQAFSNGAWVDINNASSADFTVSFGMIVNILDANYNAKLRVVATSGSKTVEGNTFVVKFNPSSLYEEPIAASYSLRAKASNNVLATVADEPVTESVNVTVRFLYGANDEQVADDKIYNVQLNSHLKDTFTLPIIEGYSAYFEDETDTVYTEYTLDLNVTSETVIVFKYWPAKVNYTVIYYWQNAEDDKYTEHDRYTTTGFTGSYTTVEDKQYDGFYQLLYETVPIASDGSTVIEVYYDRLYYKMTFDLAGGYGVQPIYARYGTPITVTNPTKAGHTFVGWDDITRDDGDEIADVLPEKIPSHHSSFRAIWKANDTAKVTVVYWGENANDESYSYLKSQELYVKPGTSLSFGSDQLICSLSPHTHSDSCLSSVTCGLEEHSHSDASGCYENCTATTHVHSESCYTVTYGRNNTSVTITKVTDESILLTLNGSSAWDNGVVRTGNKNSNYRYYMELDGVWYRLTRSNGVNINNNTTVNWSYKSSCPGEHSHSKECLSCTQPLHAHEASCYPCIEHKHNSDCYLSASNIETSLWTYVNSDTVTVSADGSTVMNVYYDRKTFTITFHYNRSSGSYRSTSTITDKWGADIATRFLEVNTTAKGNLWSESTEGNSPWTSYLQIMPERNVDYYCIYTSTNAQSAEYYVQELDGSYSLEYTVNAYYSGGTLTISKEDFYEMVGFTYSHGTDGDRGNMPSAGSYGDFAGAKFYYKRDSFILDFNNGEGVVKTENVLYEKSLSGYDFTPDVPSYYEPGSVQFAGWYLNPECTGDRYILSEHNMPASNLILYAKWIPVAHTVRFYLDETLDRTDDNVYSATVEGTTITYKYQVPHGSAVQNPYTPPNDPAKGQYIFVGWFYIDANGKEQMWDFENTTVTRDTDIYAKWSSNTLVEYTVRFVYKNGDVETEIAAPITGSALGGNSKTFDAKGNDQLYSGYQEGYFPTTQSHTIVMDLDNPKNNTFTFYYTKENAVPYTVYYVTSTQNDEGSLESVTLNGKTYYVVADTETRADNKKAIVTETYKKVPGYLPNSYQQTLIINPTEDAQNIIIFEYDKDEENGMYVVHYWIEELDGSYSEHSIFEGRAEKGSTVTATVKSIENFTHNPLISGTVLSGAISIESVLELHVYYTRNNYPFKVQYLEQGTNKVLSPEKIVTNNVWEEIVTAKAIEIANFTLIGDAEKSIIIRKDTTDPTVNIITFYYTENRVTINYVVAEGTGTVNPGSESVKILNGVANGSKATAGKGYRFVGWYSDGACTNLLSQEPEFVPTKETGTKWVNGTTFYAKFEPDNTSLTIKKVYPDGADYSIDKNQTFIFTIKGVPGTNTAAIDLTVTIHGSGEITITDLPIGDYVVMEQTEWSWRYEPTEAAQSITLHPVEINGVVFKNTRAEIYWLDGDSYKVNIFKKKEQ